MIRVGIRVGSRTRELSRNRIAGLRSVPGAFRAEDETVRAPLRLRWKRWRSAASSESGRLSSEWPNGAAFEAPLREERAWLDVPSSCEGTKQQTAARQ